MTMLPFDIYVHPDFSYKPSEWAATTTSSTSSKTKKGVIAAAATLGLSAVAATAGALMLVDREVLLAQVRRVIPGVGVERA